MVDEAILAQESKSTGAGASVAATSGERPRPGPLSRVYRSLIVALVLAGLLTAATFCLSWRAQSEDQWVRHTLAVRYQIEQVLIFVQQMETSQRGYLLTGKGQYLSPFAGAQAALPDALARMTALIGEDPVQRSSLDRLRRAVDDKVRELQSTIDARKAGDAEAALAIVDRDEGLRLMDQISRIVGDIVAYENQNLASRQANVEAVALLAQWGAGVVFVALLAITTLTSVLTRRSFAEIAASRDQIAATNASLIEQISRREVVERQLRQAQKMEAIGQLTGGIAHDFNNMLGVIIGNLELLSRKVRKGDFAIERHGESAIQAAQRAANLTHRLLAFARQQPLAPVPIDANKTILDMSDLLRSTLGEHVIIESVTAAGLWKTYADPHQLENAILNIAINARDAMPDGGKLTLETANAFLDEAYCRENADVQVGQYVLIAATDNGSGMSAEAASRAFDPFYTTKPAGVGTGLGLSQVYGFVKQSQGHIKIYSEIGAGTTVKIYLPRLASAAEAAKSAAPMAPRRGHSNEHIVVVEDDESMLRTTAEAIRELGYSVSECESAAAALTVLSERSATLLLTDVVMRDISGKQLADQVGALYPALKMLFMTGYTRNAVVHGGVIDTGVRFLGKPFTIEQLSTKLREVLDE